MIRQLIADALIQAIEHARETGALNISSIPDFTVDRPANSEFGDFSINLAMIVAGQVNRPPREVAAMLLEVMSLPPNILQRAEVSGPGFINLYLHPAWMHEVVQAIVRMGREYGRINLGKGRSVLVEFVSANPNGPLSIRHGRGAVLGDVLCNVLDAAGFLVSREFYINDAATSTQMLRFGESLVSSYLQLLGQDIDAAEDGYLDQYIFDIARSIVEEDGDQYVTMPAPERMHLFTQKGRAAMLERQRQVLRDFGVSFDSWFSESILLESGALEDVLQELQARGETFTADGALWLTTSRYGDDTDRPLVRSNGKPTYLASDVAYHRNKISRGFDMLIDIWGPDHHAYIARTKAALSALGIAPERLQVVVYQMVRLLRNGEYVIGGKRKSDILLLSELIEQLGRDAARFHLLLHEAERDAVVDLDLAVRQTADNPLYVVQHAYGRAALTLRDADEEDMNEINAGCVEFQLLQHEAEIRVMRRLADLMEVVTTTAESCQPHRIALYALQLAGDLHDCFDQCPALREDVSPELRRARLAVAMAAKITMGNVLTLLGVRVPDAS